MKKKSTSQTPRTLTKNAILLAIAVLALYASPAIALADGCIGQTAWIVGNGDWFTRTNWDNGVPTTSASAQINTNNGGTANIGTAGAVACELFLGFSASHSGNVSVNGGRLAVGTEVEVGGSGTGKLSITNGGTVSAGLLTIAALSSGSVGTVSVDGSTFTTTGRCDVGGDNQTLGGVGLLSVTSGGSVSAGNVHLFKSGTLTGNSTVSTTNGTNVEGTLKPSGRLTIGSGNLTIANGGTMVCSVTQQAWDNVYVASPGTATLDSTNSKLIVTMTGTFTTPADFPLLYAPGGLFGRFFSVSITYSTGCLSPSIVYHYDTGYVDLHVESSC
jgi:T5SS/PEP-CTERM-associated repeat protein